MSFATPYRWNRNIKMLLCLLLCFGLFHKPLQAQRQMEWLNRGLNALKTNEHTAFLSWRLLATDKPTAAFRLYRSYAEGKRELIADITAQKGTNYLDSGLKPQQEVTYHLYSLDGQQEHLEAELRLKAEFPVQPYLEIPLKTPKGYTPGDMSVADLDGDGNYELIVHQTGKGHDNSHNGLTDEPIFQAYRLDGTLLWEINLGKNIREGAHYTQFMVYDLDGDGLAEFVCKTADGTVDGQGTILGDPNADWRDTLATSNTFGGILQGPEFLTVFDGFTGKVRCTVPYVPERGDVMSWGDQKANRADRFLAGIAYLDGKHPSLIMTRGYYDRTALVAWDFKNNTLRQRWVFDTKQKDHPYSGQGYHSLAIADVDQDGKDEIIFGAMVIDNNGKGLYSTGLGHGDALHVGDLDPDRPGLEIFGIHEHKGASRGPGASLRDAKTGEILFTGSIDQDVTRGVAEAIDPNHRGAYMWWLTSPVAYTMQGKVVGERPRSVNFLIWWDDDLSRELLDDNRIEKYQQGLLFEASGAASINGTKRTPNLSADILGDWREELILRAEDNQSLRIYSTCIPTDHRLYTLMHDPTYRLSVAWQNVAYNQPPHAGYYIGPGMPAIKQPQVKLLRPKQILSISGEMPSK